MPLICPAVLTFVYEAYGRRHTLMVSIGIEGDNAGLFLVGLRIGRSWSGWHGFVIFFPNGAIDILVHHRGDDNNLREVRLNPLSDDISAGVFLWDDHGITRVLRATITTRNISQRQIAVGLQRWNVGVPVRYDAISANLRLRNRRLTLETMPDGSIRINREQQQQQQQGPPNITIIDRELWVRDDEWVVLPA